MEHRRWTSRSCYRYCHLLYRHLVESNKRHKFVEIILLCASAWFVPIITSMPILTLLHPKMIAYEDEGFIALFSGWYHPVSGNWCWIQDSLTYLRHVLTHGWRFVIVFIVTGLCIHPDLPSSAPEFHSLPRPVVPQSKPLCSAWPP
jgi:hypothetical protein